MAEVWVKDLNYNILAGGRHWQELPTSEPGLIHPQWRRSVSDNMLMNFFQTPNTTDITTFADYYSTPVYVMLAKFLERSQTIPFYEDGEDEHERARLHVKRIRRARVALKTAVRVAGANDNLKPRPAGDARPVVTMSTLYTTAYDTLATDFDRQTKEDVDLILDAMESFQRALKWICVPFLRFKSDVNPSGRARPSDADLILHVSGDDHPLAMGLGVFTYEKFIFYNPDTDTRFPTLSNEERWDLYMEARRFAIASGFLDGRSVVERVQEELVQELAEFTGLGLDNCKSSLEALAKVEPYGGGGNGYKCKIVNGVRTCVVSTDPADYCVNNGSTYCAT